MVHLMGLGIWRGRLEDYFDKFTVLCYNIATYSWNVVASAPRGGAPPPQSEKRVKQSFTVPEGIR